MSVFLSAVLAGLCIGIGGCVYLMLDSAVLSAFFFTMGLFCVCTMGLHLYTGKVCYSFRENRRYALRLPIIWLGNLCGTGLVALLMRLTRIGTALVACAQGVCAIKLGDAPGSVFILAIFCNMLIYIGVNGYHNNPHELGKYLALFFGVMVFTLCGFEHCVADMFFFSMAGVWSLRTLGYLLLITLGNAVGGITIPLLQDRIKACQKSAD